MGSTKPPSLSVGSIYSRIKKVQLAQNRDIQIKSAQSLVRTEHEQCLADDFENSTQVRRLSEPARPCQEDEQTLDCEQRLRAGEVEGLDCDGEACGGEPCDAADKRKKAKRSSQQKSMLRKRGNIC